MKRPHTDDGPLEGGDLVIWMGEDGVPRIQTAPDPDDIVLDEAGLLRGLFAESREEAIRAIEGAIEPSGFEATWKSTGLSFDVGDFTTGTQFEMTYPFTMTAFWTELGSVEHSALNPIEDE